MLPEGLRDRLDRVARRWTIENDGPNWRLTCSDGSSFVLDGPEGEARERIARIAPEAVQRSIDVKLSAGDVLRRRFSVPIAALSHLHSIAQLQLDRLSPFPAETVSFDCRAIPAAEEAEVALMPRARLEEIDAKLAVLGFAVRRFVFEEFTFAPIRRRWTTDEKRIVALALVAAVATAVSLSIAPVMRQNELDALTAEIAQLRGPALNAAAARNELDRLATPMKLLSEDLRAADPLEVLRALSESVPRDSHLAALHFEPKSVDLQVIGPDPVRLVAELKQSGEFREVRPSGGANGSFGIHIVPLGGTAGP
jgi:general secretion pathway protein L